MWRPSPRSNNPDRARDYAPADAGRASLEFLVAGVILFIPIVLLTVSLWSIQNASLATEAAARHAARVFTQATSLGSALDRSEAAVRQAMGAFGIDSGYRIDLQCRPAGQCVAPGSDVRVVVTAEVGLGSIPLVPATLPLSVPITGSADARVSPYRGAR